MLSSKQIEDNYIRFKEMLISTDRPGIKELIEFIDSTDFKTAPASTIYHCDFDGGLCQHSLNVHMNLNFLIKAYSLDYSDDSVILVSLLHDLSKTNFYEKYFKNQKLYSDNGSKHDDNGSFDWVSVLSYKIKDPELRDLGGDHGTNSFLLANDYIKLNREESAAIINHHMGLGEVSPNKDLNSIADKYPLVFLLHMADMASVYICENENIKSHRINNEQKN